MRDHYDSTDYAIGVLAYCKTQSDIKYLLIHHTKGHWGFPKGHSELGENKQQTALRELREETGVSDITLLTDELYTTHYQFKSHGSIVHKQVDYYLGHCDQCWPTTTQAIETIHAGRYTFDQALDLLTFDTSKDVLIKINKQFQLK